jgi:hypothetical protein
MIERRTVEVTAFALLALVVGRVAALEFAADPMPTLMLDDPRAGESPEHRLQVFAEAGELETYRAIVQYPEGFVFEGFLELGPANTPVGAYELDLNEDGVADVSSEIRSRGPDRPNRK